MHSIVPVKIWLAILFSITVGMVIAGTPDLKSQIANSHTASIFSTLNSNTREAFSYLDNLLLGQNPAADLAAVPAKTPEPITNKSINAQRVEPASNTITQEDFQALKRELASLKASYNTSSQKPQTNSSLSNQSVEASGKVSEADAKSLSAALAAVNGRIDSLSNRSNALSQSIAYSQRVDNISNVTLSNVTFSDTGGHLPLTGGSLTGNLGVGATNPSAKMQVTTTQYGYTITESIGGSSSFSSVGTAKTWRGDDTLFSYTIPFSFPFFGSNITKIQVSTNGVLWMCESCGDSTGYPSSTNLPSQKVIAPLWGDWITDGSGQASEDIYIDESVSNQVTIRWKGEVYGSATDIVNFSVTLYSNGNIIFQYGSGNTNLQYNATANGMIAVSNGDSPNYKTLSFSGGTSQTNTYDTTITTNTGVSLASAFLVNSASANFLTVLNSGNVGIGTTTPNNLLGVYNLIDFDNGNFNTKLGYQAGKNIVSGAQYNTFLGYQAGMSSSTASTNAADYNTAIGYRSLYSNTTGSVNSAFGVRTLYSNTTGYYNTANGMDALYSNTTGNYNTAIGRAALYSNTTASFNTALGHYVLPSNTTGSSNSALGHTALQQNTTGSSNTALGNSALYVNTTGSYNTAVGQTALTSNTTGSNNSALGYYVLRYNGSATNTVAVGYQAAASTARYNNQGGVYLGYQAGYSAGTGSDYNTLLGYQAGYGITTGAYNIVIGQNVEAPTVTGNQQLNIGNVIYGSGMYNGSTVSSAPVSAGRIGIGTTTPAWTLQVASTSPYIAITDTDAGTNLKHWVFRNENGNLYIATSSDIYATSSIPALMINANGNVGIGTSSPSSQLSIQGTCVDTGTGCADVAELYPSTEPVEPGDIVAVDPEHAGSVKKAQATSSPIGIVSTNPAISIEGSSLQFMTGASYISDPLKPAVALVGRVPVKVSLESGPIKIGDRIMISSMPGVGMKAASSSITVGIALEDYNQPDIGKIMVFASLGREHIDNGLAALTSSTTNAWSVDQSTGKVNVNFFGDVNLNGNSIINIAAAVGIDGNWRINKNGELVVKKVTTEKLEVGSPSVPTGITVYDKQGRAGCLIIENVETGAMSLAAGACGVLGNSGGQSAEDGGQVTRSVVSAASSTVQITEDSSETLEPATVPASMGGDSGEMTGDSASATSDTGQGAGDNSPPATELTGTTETPPAPSSDTQTVTAEPSLIP